MSMAAEPHGFDLQAFRAAVRAAAQPRLVGVTLPGIGACWVRPLTAGDWVDAHSATARLAADGVEVTPRLRMAIGLAQNLCGPLGEPIFSPSSLDDLQTLASLPADVVADALSSARELDAPTETPSPNA